MVSSNTLHFSVSSSSIDSTYVPTAYSAFGDPVSDAQSCTHRGKDYILYSTKEVLPCVSDFSLHHFFKIYTFLLFCTKMHFLFHLVFYFFPKECFKIIPNTATFPFIWRKALPKHYLSYLSELSPLVVSHIVMSPWFQNMIQTGHGSPRVLTTSSSPQTPHIHGRKRQTEVVIDPDYATYS